MTSTTILSHFANFKLAGDRVVRDAVLSMQSAEGGPRRPSAMHTFFASQGSSRTHNASRHRRRRRQPPGRSARFSSHSTSRVHAMTDADLEAELAARRAARARERDRYAKAMRSEKLSLLEGELMRLRNEISRLDYGGAGPLGGGTPPTSRWEALGGDARSRSPSLRPGGPGPRTGSLASPNGPPAPAGPPNAAPPPPPPRGPPPPPGADGDGPGALDPERQKREKADRQRRREQKRKEREAAKKPLTLAEIIKAAGPDPAKRLKPRGSTALEDSDALDEQSKEEKDAETFSSLKASLKKAALVKKEEVEKGKTVEGTEWKRERGEGGNRDVKVDEEEEQGVKSNDAKSQMNVGKPNQAKATRREEREVANATSSKANADISTENNSDLQAPKALESEGSDAKQMHAKASEESDLTRESKVEISESLGEIAVKVSSTKSLNADGNDVQTEPKSVSAEVSASDALSALSALSANLPQKKSSAPSSTSKKPGRMSLAEKRRLRKASSGASANKDTASEGSSESRAELADVLAAASALKID